MNLKKYTDSELYLLFHEVKAEMNDRNLATDVGRIGEDKVLKFFANSSALPNLVEAAPGTKNVDALSRDGERYSIKTVLTSRKTSCIYPGSGESKPLFEYMVILKINADFSLSDMYRVSWSDFLTIRAWDKRMNAWYVPVNNKRLSDVERLF